ncbi:MAG: hypothetical protein ABEJ90_00365 [Halobacterium sp.]
MFGVGTLVGQVESARANLDDAIGLRDAHHTESMRAFDSALSVAASRLEEAFYATKSRADEVLAPAVDASDVFDRDLEGTPARELFVEARVRVLGAENEIQRAMAGADHAVAAANCGRGLVGAVALATVVDAIRDGEHDRPESTAAARARRESAVEALRGTRSVSPRPVARVLAEPAWEALADAEERLAGYGGDEIDSRDVLAALGEYALAEHLANAVPEVTERVTGELRAAAD